MGILRGVRLNGEFAEDCVRGLWIPLKGLSDVILYGIDQNDEYLHSRLKLGFAVFWYEDRGRRAVTVGRLERMVVDGSTQPPKRYCYR